VRVIFGAVVHARERTEGHEHNYNQDDYHRALHFRPRWCGSPMNAYGPNFRSSEMNLA
jgi:hypothetical protein